jgi:hypothetical protein
MLESTLLPPQPPQSHVLNLSSPSFDEPSFIAQGQTNLCKVHLCEPEMSKGKTSHPKATSLLSWSSSMIKDVRFVLVSKSKMCATMKKKIESLDKKPKDVHGDARRVRMNFQDREKLLVEAHVNLEKTNINVASAKEELFHYEKKGGFATSLATTFCNCNDH